MRPAFYPTVLQEVNEVCQRFAMVFVVLGFVTFVTSKDIRAQIRMMGALHHHAVPAAHTTDATIASRAAALHAAVADLYSVLHACLEREGRGLLLHLSDLDNLRVDMTDIAVHRAIAAIAATVASETRDAVRSFFHVATPVRFR